MTIGVRNAAPDTTRRYAAELATYVAALVAAAPPLSAETSDRIALLFRGTASRDQRHTAA